MIRQKIARWQKINRVLARLDNPDLPPYVPGEHHWDAHLSLAREKLIAGGERGGKSRSVAQELVGMIPRHQRARFWLAAKKYSGAHVEFSNTVVLLQCLGALPWKHAELRQLVHTPRDRQWTIECIGDFEGIEIATLSADEIVNVSRYSLDGAVMCEAAQMELEVYRRLQGRVAERFGWLIMSGTFERTEGVWYGVKFLEWERHTKDDHRQCFSFPTWANLVLFEEGRESQKYKDMIIDSPPDRISERYDGRPVRPATLVFPQFDFGTHVGGNLFQEKIP